MIKFIFLVLPIVFFCNAYGQETEIPEPVDKQSCSLTTTFTADNEYTGTQSCYGELYAFFKVLETGKKISTTSGKVNQDFLEFVKNFKYAVGLDKKKDMVFYIIEKNNGVTKSKTITAGSRIVYRIVLSKTGGGVYERKVTGKLNIAGIPLDLQNKEKTLALIFENISLIVKTK
jgi:hypothetical protein